MWEGEKAAKRNRKTEQHRDGQPDKLHMPTRFVTARSICVDAFTSLKYFLSQVLGQLFRLPIAA